MPAITKQITKEIAKDISAKHLDIAIWLMTICSVIDTITTLLEHFLPIH